MFKYIEYNQDEVEALVKSYQHQTPLPAMTLEDINALLVNGYEVNYG